MKREEVNKLTQLVSLDKCKALYEKIDANHTIKVLTIPTEQTLLVPVKDPISNGDFYAGEVLVTSTIVQVEQTKGWSMVIDSQEELSLYTAVFDACFEAGIFKEEIVSLLDEANSNQIKAEAALNKKVNSTRVSFDLM